MIVDQQLHGYKNGHELLSGSLTLPPRDQDLVDRLSDIAGPIAPGEKIPPYITCYPLPGGSHYVVARTWHDRDAPRAGCVRTRSLLIPIAEWANSADPLALVAAATAAGPTQKLKGISIHSEPGAAPAPVEAAGAELLEALFLETAMPVAVFGSKSPEVIGLRILMALWPSMRRRFALSTFCNSPRTISKRSFDLVFAPAEARPRFSDWKGRRVDGTKASPSRHPWSSRISQEVFRSPHPSLAALDTFGEMAGDEKGSEEALRLSLLWGELADRVPTEPQAALGLLDIANSRGDRRSRLVTELAPVLAQAASSAASADPPAEAWRFLRVLVGKLGGMPWPSPLIHSVQSTALTLARRHPVEAVEVIPDILRDDAELLLSGMTMGLANAEPFDPVARRLTSLSGDVLLDTVLSAPELTSRLLEAEYGVERALADSIASAPDGRMARARRSILPQVVHSRHAILLDALLADADATMIETEAKRLNSANGLTEAALNDVLANAAGRKGAVPALRNVVMKARRSQPADAMLRRLVQPAPADVHWILDTMEKADARRPVLLGNVLATAGDEQLRSIFKKPGVLARVLELLGDLPAYTELLARVVEKVRLEPAEQISLTISLLPRIQDKARATAFAVAGLEKALAHDDVDLRERVISTLLDRSEGRFDAARILLVGAGRDVPAGLASSNLVLFDRSRAEVRATFVRDPVALADTVAGRRSLDLTYPAGEAVGRLLWDSDAANHRAFLLASARLLSFATNTRKEAASPIIAASFPSVYRELQRESLPDFLSYVFPFVDWDRCKVARRELARALLSSDWRPSDIALAAARAGDPDRILRNIAKRERGPQAIHSIERNLGAIPEPWRRQIRKVIEGMRNDPLWEKLPFGS